jgi:uncharacterized membrane protein YqjE
MSATEEPALLSLMKDLVDALGTLIAGHLRLARAELGDDARLLVRRATLAGFVVALGLVGYGLACVAGALALAPLTGAPLAFLAVGGAHLVGASVCLAVWLRHAPPRPLGESLTALDRTVTALAASADGALRPARQRSAGALEGAVP